MTIDPFTVVAQALNFVLLIWLLNRLLFAPVAKAMRERQAAIAEQIAAASRAQAEAATLAERAVAREQAAIERRSELAAAAQREAEQVRATLLNQARQEIAKQRDEWSTALERDLDTQSRDVQHRLATAFAGALQRGFADLADAELNERMVARLIRRLEDWNSVEWNAAVGDAQDAEVRSAYDLSAPQAEALRRLLLARAGIRNVTFSRAPELIAGAAVALGERQIELNVAEYLRGFADQLRVDSNPHSHPQPAAHQP